MLRHAFPMNGPVRFNYFSAHYPPVQGPPPPQMYWQPYPGHFSHLPYIVPPQPFYPMEYARPMGHTGPIEHAGPMHYTGPRNYYCPPDGYPGPVEHAGPILTRILTTAMYRTEVNFVSRVSGGGAMPERSRPWSVAEPLQSDTRTVLELGQLSECTALISGGKEGSKGSLTHGSIAA
ncbi:hypothetical protein OPT61_g9485 [Boeremia exigua]|uniref:Uncharacterized protein n=1 Tax=Boeremia exigua TaxID=749465 RepID=A0ACC2HU70_9PLEO|nr:hypothetical protein OPT61_g9485 [Boeremia exigua]